MSRARAAAALLLTFVIASGCGGPAPVSPSAPVPSPAPGSPAPATATLAMTPSLLPSPIPTPVPSPSSVPTLPPTPTPPGTAAPSPTPTPAAGFSCAYPLRRAATTTSMTAVTDVRVGTHPGYDRVVFEFEGSRLPALRLDRVSPPFEKDPSGLPLAVEGSSFVRILLERASGEEYARPDGEPTYTGPSAFSPGYPLLTSLVRAGDFEAQVAWIAGLTGPACYHVSVLRSPTRLVIDFQAP